MMGWVSLEDQGGTRPALQVLCPGKLKKVEEEEAKALLENLPD